MNDILVTSGGADSPSLNGIFNWRVELENLRETLNVPER